MPRLAVKPHVSVESWVLEPSSGPDTIVVSGGPVSTANARVCSTKLPAASVARTVSV